jgi:putative SOS response-associated peptidase YedK
MGDGPANSPFRAQLRIASKFVPAKRGHKTKYRIARKDGDMFGLAGLYDVWKSPSGHELTTCTIITCQPNAVLAPIHNRMPVILLPITSGRDACLSALLATTHVDLLLAATGF